MTEVEKILDEFEPLFKEAVRKKLFFHSFHYGWFHPDEIKAGVERGNFQFKSKEWKLRNPKEKLEEFDDQIDKMYKSIENLKKNRAVFESKIVF